MAKYLLKRLFYGIICIIIVVAIVMVLIYSLLPKQRIFATDATFTKVLKADTYGLCRCR